MYLPYNTKVSVIQACVLAVHGHFFLLAASVGTFITAISGVAIVTKTRICAYSFSFYFEHFKFQLKFAFCIPCQRHEKW